MFKVLNCKKKKKKNKDGIIILIYYKWYFEYIYKFKKKYGVLEFLDAAYVNV